MNAWTFDLAKETDPIRRLGIHGLWRLLHYGGSGEFSDCYPDVRQSKTLQWEMTDTVITLRWETVDDLNLLMGCQLGDFRRGVGVIPGYETDPDLPGFYATARGHLGITGTYFFSTTGMRRSDSLAPPAKTKGGGETGVDQEKREKKEAQKGALLAEWKAMFPGNDPTTVVKNLPKANSTEEEPASLELPVNPHARSRSLPSSSQWTPPMLTAGKKGLESTGYGNVIHPALAKWNAIEIKAYPKDFFVASFSCLSYIYTKAVDVVGLGMDFPTFSEADAKHQIWASGSKGTCVLWVEGNSRTAAWTIASLLNLPPRTYSVLSPEGHFLFSPETPKMDVGKVYALVSSGLIPKSKLGEIKSLGSIPVRVKPDGGILEEFLDVLLRNLEHGFAWYRDLGGVATIERTAKKSKETTVGLRRWERTALQKITERPQSPLESEMEQRIAKRMKSLFESLVHANRKHFSLAHPSPANKWTDPAREKARDFAIRVHLNRAFNRSSILSALSRIRSEVTLLSPDTSAFFFDDEEFAWLLQRSDENPGEVRSLLIFACEVRSTKKATPTGQPVTSDESLAGTDDEGDSAADSDEE